MKLVTQTERVWLDSLVSPSTGVPPVLGTIVTANKSATQAASAASDVAGIVADFNALLAKLKAAGIVL